MSNTQDLSVQAQQLRSFVRDLPDYPSPGIIFRDITPLLADPRAFGLAIQSLASLVPEGTQYVAGMEARGFIFGAALARHLNIGFIPIRKAGKLPPPVRSYTYDLEYGQATVEIRDETVPNNARVVLVDDVLATGGTAKAGAALLEECGAEVTSVVFLMELEGLPGRSVLEGRAVSTVMTL